MNQEVSATQSRQYFWHVVTIVSCVFAAATLVISTSLLHTDLRNLQKDMQQLRHDFNESQKEKPLAHPSNAVLKSSTFSFPTDQMYRILPSDQHAE